ncbi:MAG TPA: hypothetical protein VMH91_04340 [Candidatus Paceibacterota bacterium]|nr:hypothetical protein [Candidatus Paceibacterota bacterium]
MVRRSGTGDESVKRQKFDFEQMKQAATHKDPSVRKKVFIEYFERFGEFPSYLFDNEVKVHEQLSETMRDILKDADVTEAMRKGVEALLRRLPS